MRERSSNSWTALFVKSKRRLAVHLENTAQRSMAATAFLDFSRASRFLRLAVVEIACSALSAFTLLGVTWPLAALGADTIIADALFSSCSGAARKLVQLHLHKHERVSDKQLILILEGCAVQLCSLAACAQDALPADDRNSSQG